ncbi:MAG: TolC family protein [Sandaracinaceae bacterium]|nr:TolC family protein [Sandaracinaceae bacterium]
MRALILLFSISAHAQAPEPDAGRGLDPMQAIFPGGQSLIEIEPIERVEIGTSPPLTLGEVLSSVERHHPQLEMAREAVRAAEGERLAAEGGFDLSLAAQGFGAPAGYYDWARADVRVEQPTELWGTRFIAGWRIGRGSPVPGYYGEHETLTGGELRAQVVVPLWRDGPIDERRARLWRSQHGVTAEAQSLEARRLAMARDAARAYWRWVAAGLKVRIASDLLTLAEARDSQIRARVAAGAIPPIEALENQRTILARQRTLIVARRGLEQSAISLSLYLRRDDGSPRVPPPARVPLAIELPTHRANRESEAIRAALARRPELERYRALIERSRVQVDYANNLLAPRIDVALGASIDVGDASSADEQSRLGQPVVEGSILLSLPLQLRDARGQIDRSRAELGSLRAEARWVREQIAAEVRDALSAVRAAEQGVRVAAQGAQIADAVAQAERRRFELGDTQLFIVNLREQAAAEARAGEVDAQADLLGALAAYRAAIGEVQ